MTASPTANAQRYTAVAIVLHWAIALAVITMLVLGFWVHEALEDRDTLAQATAALQIHKSIGLTILMLSVLRLVWRVMNPPPPLPAAMPAWEKFVARATHWAFYAFIIIMPLTGWLYVSTGWSAPQDRPLEVPTLWFGLFQVPHLFGLNQFSLETREALGEALGLAHWNLALAAVALIALHVGAALKHHFINKDEVLTHMVPGLGPIDDSAPQAAPAPKGHNAVLIAGFTAIVLAGLGVTWALSTLPSGARAEVAQTDISEPANHDAASPDVQEPSGSAFSATMPTPVAAGPPPSWTVNQSASSIAFTGDHAGVAFEGRFSRWQAEIRFDPNNLDASSATVTIETASASDGVPLHDNSLPEREWFDVANHPTATFRTIEIRDRGDGRYQARGALTIKGRPIDVRLPFTLRIEGDRAIMDGSISLTRREADLGMSSDPDAEYVSPEIGVRVHVEATRSQ